MTWGEQGPDYLPEIVDSVHRKHISCVEEIEWTGDNISDIWTFLQPTQEPVHLAQVTPVKFSNADEVVGIVTPTGLDFAGIGDYIVREGNKLTIRKCHSRQVNIRSME